MRKNYYMHSDGHLYEVTPDGVRRVTPNGERRLGCLPLILMGIALWVFGSVYAYMVWTWARAGALLQ